MLNEEWKNAAPLGFSNYLCSNSGQIFDISHNKILKGYIVKNSTVHRLKNDEGKSKDIREHIFVSKLFINPEQEEINSLKIKKENDLELSEEWKSASELGLSNYMCSNNGSFFNISNNKILKGSMRNNRKIYTLINDRGESKEIRAHNLVTKLFTNYNEIKNNYIWYPVPDYEKYKICEEGKFLSTRGEIMETFIQRGTVVIHFTMGNKSSNLRVCMLVATVFIPNPNNFKYIKFKDGNSLNINKNNLEWADNTSKVEDPDDEIWEPLIEFPKYQINPKGIRNSITHEMLTPQLSSNGYPALNLCIDNNKSKHVELHRAISIQYIPNPDPCNLIQVNHKNGIKQDFRIKNLEWVTPSQNIQHAVDTGLLPAHKSGRSVELLDENHNIVHTFITTEQAAEYVGCCDRTVSNHLKSNLLGNETAVINNFILRYKICIDLEGEIWKPANTVYSNINDRYKISNYGRIKNKNNKLLTPNFNEKSYSQISLSNYIKNKKFDKDKNSHAKIFSVHVLVAYAFLDFKGNRDDYQVNHKDKNTKNNHIDNLEILLTRDHIIKDLGKPVLCVTKNTEYYIFPSQSTSAYLPEMNTKNIHYAINHGNNYQNHYWYNFDSQEAQTIIEEFESKGINASIPPKFEIISQDVPEFVSESKFEIVSQSPPKRKLKLIIVS